MNSRFCIVIILALALLPAPAHAYIGPGAGFAFLGSAAVFIVSILLAVLTLAIWPFQLAWRKVRGLGVSKRARTRRLVIVGLDGLEPKLTEQYMAEGKLPNLKALAESGAYSRLGTTLPALSPVAWSTFQTGVNPGAHNIFDFLTRDKRSCMPQLASTETSPVSRFLKLGSWKVPLGAPELRITRKSQPFWKVLGKYGVFSNVLRVPISYPAEPFFGNVLSAMCTPDLKGSQGSFTFLTTRKQSGEQRVTGGDVRVLTRSSSDKNVLTGVIEGPPDPKRKGQGLTCEFTLRVVGPDAILNIARSVIPLKLNQFSDWVEVRFSAGVFKTVSGICRFCLRELGDEVSLYVSPINVNPEKPCLPISQPMFFATWLAKRLGLFGTLGLMEDTWGRNELALDDRRFLDQTWLTHDERERMFLDTLERSREGVCICVFDASDRIQHMFWRYLENNHPSPCEDRTEFGATIPEMYQRMDALMGRVRAKLKPEDALIVLSDHGFASFKRCVNLNTWLLENGYLVTKGGVTGADYLSDVDWSKTRAYALGLSGIFINRAGRESRGIVKASEVESLKREISERLEKLVDPQSGERAVSKMYDSAKHYRGLYSEEAPDLVVGYCPGFRVSWDSITGTIEPAVFSDNLKAWSGDHHVDPALIPGVFFSNRKLKVGDPSIIDIAPTALDLFAIKPPAYMEGRVVL